MCRFPFTDSDRRDDLHSGVGNRFDESATVDRWDTVESDNSEIQGLVLETPTSFRPLTSKVLLVGQQMTVGRAKGCDQPVPMDKKMSRWHFSIHCESDHAVVHDLGSTNGTFVNGMRVSELRVHDGDQISAGMTIFVVRMVQT